MSLMAAAIQGLPPMPKSLSGLLNFNRESLSREQALSKFYVVKNKIERPERPFRSHFVVMDEMSSISGKSFIVFITFQEPRIRLKCNIWPRTRPRMSPIAVVSQPPLKMKLGE